MITFATIKIKNKRLMKKLAYILFIVFTTVSVSSCSKGDADELQPEQEMTQYPCKFSIIYEQVGKPEIKFAESGRYGKPERIINFEISDYYEMVLNQPSPENTANYFTGIRESDFRVYQSHFTSLGDFNPPTSERIYVGVMRNDDYFRFDKNETRNTGIIKVEFHCIHIE